ncbi:MAG: hypothetical protein GF398_08305 [Chitinivibrionales bacterium]|nr:hypothetical protein [Chitinivibrionales bacterium]
MVFAEKTTLLLLIALLRISHAGGIICTSESYEYSDTLANGRFRRTIIDSARTSGTHPGPRGVISKTSNTYSRKTLEKLYLDYFTSSRYVYYGRQVYRKTFAIQVETAVNIDTLYDSLTGGYVVRPSGYPSEYWALHADSICFAVGGVLKGAIVADTIYLIDRHWTGWHTGLWLNASSKTVSILDNVLLFVDSLSQYNPAEMAVSQCGEPVVRSTSGKWLLINENDMLWYPLFPDVSIPFGPPVAVNKKQTVLPEPRQGAVLNVGCAYDIRGRLLPNGYVKRAAGIVVVKYTRGVFRDISGGF